MRIFLTRTLIILTLTVVSVPCTAALAGSADSAVDRAGCGNSIGTATQLASPWQLVGLWNVLSPWHNPPAQLESFDPGATKSTAGNVSTAADCKIRICLDDPDQCYIVPCKIAK